MNAKDVTSEESDTSTAGAVPAVLVVEDNAAMRALIRDLVEPVTPMIYECEDGESAVKVYDRIRPDWVLMDIQMRGMGGIAATRAIRRLDPQARIIIVTEHDAVEYRRAARAAGACGFVLKRDLLELPAVLVHLPMSAGSD